MSGATAVVDALFDWLRMLMPTATWQRGCKRQSRFTFQCYEPLFVFSSSAADCLTITSAPLQHKALSLLIIISASLVFLVRVIWQPALQAFLLLFLWLFAPPSVHCTKASESYQSKRSRWSGMCASRGSVELQFRKRKWHPTNRLEWWGRNLSDDWYFLWEIIESNLQIDFCFFFPAQVFQLSFRFGEKWLICNKKLFATFSKTTKKSEAFLCTW